MPYIPIEANIWFQAEYLRRGKCLGRDAVTGVALNDAERGRRQMQHCIYSTIWALYLHTGS